MRRPRVHQLTGGWLALALVVPLAVTGCKGGSQNFFDCTATHLQVAPVTATGLATLKVHARLTTAKGPVSGKLVRFDLVGKDGKSVGTLHGGLTDADGNAEGTVEPLDLQVSNPVVQQRLLSAVSYSAHFDAGLDKDKSGLALCDVTATAAVTFH